MTWWQEIKADQLLPAFQPVWQRPALSLLERLRLLSYFSDCLVSCSAFKASQYYLVLVCMHLQSLAPLCWIHVLDASSRHNLSWSALTHFKLFRKLHTFLYTAFIWCTGVVALNIHLYHTNSNKVCIMKLSPIPFASAAASNMICGLAPKIRLKQNTVINIMYSKFEDS